MDEKIAVLYTTVHHQEQAQALAKQALSHKLAFCVNIFPQTQSFYLWQEKVDQAQEHAILFKTTVALMASLKDWILCHHPYETPALLTTLWDTSPAFFAYAHGSLAQE